MRRSESSAVGYDPSEFGMTQDEVAKILGMTRRQVQAIEYRALRKLAKAARASKTARELMGLQ